MNKSSIKQAKRTRRHNRIRATVSGTPVCPRLAVFRSNTAMYVQLIDDVAGKTLVAADTRSLTTGSSREKAHQVGKSLAEAAKKAGIERVVFDRGGFLFTGSIKEVAEGAREGGLMF